MRDDSLPDAKRLTFDPHILTMPTGGLKIESGIIVVEENPDVDLRITSNLLDLYKLQFERRYFDRYLSSDVEYFARLHSIEFTDYHAKLLAPHLHNALIADIGCGQLPYAPAFQGLDIAAYYAIDLDRASLNIAKQNNRGPFPVYFIQNGITNLPLQTESVDAVISSEVIEHVDDPIAYLREMHRICKPGGHLSISTPCASMYLYPHNLIGLVRHPGSIRQWWRQMNAHKCWDAALAWHPGLRPAIFRQWLQEAGFAVIEHKSQLWYYGTPFRPAWRLFAALERMGVASSGKMFARYLRGLDTLLAANVPVIRWAGTRQFALCRKPH